MLCACMLMARERLDCFEILAEAAIKLNCVPCAARNNMKRGDACSRLRPEQVEHTDHVCCSEAYVLLSMNVLRKKSNELMHVRDVGRRIDMLGSGSLSTVSFAAETRNANHRVGPVFISENVALSPDASTGTTTTSPPPAADAGPVVGGRISVEPFNFCDTVECGFSSWSPRLPPASTAAGPPPANADSPGTGEAVRRVDKGAPATVPVHAFFWANIERHPHLWSESIWSETAPLFDDSTF